LNLLLEPDNSQATAIAATVLLQRKGRVLDSITDSLGALRKHSDPQDQALLDQLKQAMAQYARVALQGPQKQPLEKYRKSLQDLQEKKEKLENTISHHSEEFRSQSQPVTVAAVRSGIPEDAALVEFVAYRRSDPKAPTYDEEYGDLRYGAYVLHRNAAPKGIDLGDAKAIDVAVDKLRGALRDPSRDVQQLARTVAEKVFQPVQALVADDKRLLISPDGQLNLIPFEALLDDQGHYLVERYSITYLTTGRDVMRMQVRRPSRSAPVLLADPLFGEPKGILVAGTAVPRVKSSGARDPRRSVTTAADFSTLYFAPLEGTRAEARSIQALFPEARVLTGEQASESALQQLNAPRILHIATHGFFLQDTSQNAAGNASTATAGPENPLLRSGLALSGANRVKDGKGEGILTALEASNLNLWGTKLVTLSACDTGVGEVKNGEGVYGLRRSFFLAGAESLVMSLWPVSDRVTREMMSNYYSGLKHGLGRGEALRQAELAMLRHKGRQHPFYWASFIQSGEWANLDGQR
jgi:CHAT domain-containing protein